MIEIETKMEYCKNDLDGVILRDASGEMEDVKFVPERTTQIENCFSDVWIEHHAQLNHCVECNNWFIYCYEDEEGWTGDLIPSYCPHCGARAI